MLVYNHTMHDPILVGSKRYHMGNVIFFIVRIYGKFTVA